VVITAGSVVIAAVLVLTMPKFFLTRQHEVTPVVEGA